MIVSRHRLDTFIQIFQLWHSSWRQWAWKQYTWFDTFAYLTSIIICALLLDMIWTYHVSWIVKVWGKLIIIPQSNLHFKFTVLKLCQRNETVYWYNRRCNCAPKYCVKPQTRRKANAFCDEINIGSLNGKCHEEFDKSWLIYYIKHIVCMIKMVLFDDKLLNSNRD